MKDITILIPTYNRAEALATTLTSLCSQTDQNFNIIISDQSDSKVLSHDNSLQTAIRILQIHGNKVQIYENFPRQGMAQQRQFLFEKSTTPYVLYLDDDLILEPWAIETMINVIKKQETGFVGMAVIGLSYKDDVRPDQQKIEFWKEQIKPEEIIPQSEQWERYKLHNAANIYHVATNHKANHKNPLLYKVAWIGGCTLYNKQKLQEVGAFEFWKKLPMQHCGEDVLAQLNVMQKYGGCGILPSGVYHQEHETTIKERKYNAPEMLFNTQS